MIAFAGRLFNRNETIVNFLNDYGSLLQVIDLKNWRAWESLTVEQLTAIRQASPVALVDYEAHRICLDRLIALRKSATGLHLTREGCMIENLSRIGRACPNLIFCHIFTNYLPRSHFAALFDAPKAKPEHMSIVLEC